MDKEILKQHTQKLRVVLVDADNCFVELAHMQATELVECSLSIRTQQRIAFLINPEEIGAA